MAAKRHERTYARKQAIQVLYQAEILDRNTLGLLADESNFIDGAKPSQYASMLIHGVEDHLYPIDSLLERYSENWAVDRMPSVDRAILRLACFEMAYVDEIPVSVAINEAVELAKEFGGEDESHRFVNGVLGRIADFLEENGGRIPGEEAAGDIDEETSSDATDALAAFDDSDDDASAPAPSAAGGDE